MTDQTDAPRASRPVVPPEPLPGIDPNELALKEQAAIAEGRLKRYKRDESIRRHSHYAGLGVFWFVVTAGMGAATIWLWHLLAPVSMHFLNNQQLQDLQNLLISALGSSLAMDYSRRWMRRMDDGDKS